LTPVRQDWSDAADAFDVFAYLIRELGLTTPPPYSSLKASSTSITPSNSVMG
jgi:hypothetical protein